VVEVNGGLSMPKVGGPEVRGRQFGRGLVSSQLIQIPEQNISLGVVRIQRILVCLIQKDSKILESILGDP
jgi:hypothetical protein